MGDVYLTSDVIVLATLAGVVLLVLWIARWQDGVERAEAEKTADQEWAESGFTELPRAEFVLCRIVPSNRWTLAEYIFQREDRSKLGRFVGRSRAHATIVFSGRVCEQYIQAHSPYAGKVGGTATDSVVLRDHEGPIAEIIPQRRLPPAQYRVQWRKQEFWAEVGGWIIPQGRVFRQEQLVARYRQRGGFSRKLLVAFHRDLPEECQICLCSLALLQG